jgi:hypothetical protein
VINPRASLEVASHDWSGGTARPIRIQDFERHPRIIKIYPKSTMWAPRTLKETLESVNKQELERLDCSGGIVPTNDFGSDITKIRALAEDVFAFGLKSRAASTFPTRASQGQHLMDL